MPTINALATAISGLRAAETRANVAAGNIANVNTPGFDAAVVRASTLVAGPSADAGSGVRAQVLEGGTAPDLGREVVELIAAEAAYKANAAVFSTAESMTRESLDLIA